MNYKYTLNDAFKKNVFGVDIAGYETKLTNIDIVYEETKAGRHEEFYDEKSTHIWFTVRGQGKFIIDDEHIHVNEKDVIVVPPKKRIYYLGKLEMVLITMPSFKPENEHHVRDIEITQ
jgi:mannose-6-phosphate isomerase-like protein (cupin superfamily)